MVVGKEEGVDVGFLCGEDGDGEGFWFIDTRITNVLF